MTALRGLILLVLSASLVGACSRNKERDACDRRIQSYVRADGGRELAVPDDLTVPDGTEALEIPGQLAPAAEAQDSCLEHSPAFAQEPNAEDD